MTVLFADLVDSTAISSGMDPEDFALCITEYLATVERIVIEYGGFVGNVIGDGLLAYFGYPTAHEDDVQGACLAGLEIVRAVGDLRVNLDIVGYVPLSTRVGINTGTALLGSVRGDSSETMAMGEAVNLAARVESSAAAGTVMVTAATQCLVANQFVFTDKGEYSFKGIANPTRLYQLVRRQRAAESVTAVMSGASTALIGRDPELHLLLDRWSEAKAGSGRIVTIYGDAGLGKSRLIGELLGRVGDEAAWLRARGSSFTQGTTLQPIIEMLPSLLGLDVESSVATDIAALERSLETMGHDPDPSVQLLAPLLQIDTLPSGYRALPFSPQIIRQMTLRLACDLFVAAAASVRPLLVVLEAAHWLDPTSFDLLDELTVRLRSTPMMLVVSSRLPLPVTWAADSTVVLNHLAADHAAALVRSLDPDSRIGEDVVADVVDRADGNPLYLEQLTRMLLDNAHDRDPVHSRLQRIPPTLTGLLLAHLDLGSTSRSTIQMAASIGRRFSFDLLSRVVGGDEKQLGAELDAHVSAGHLIVRGRGRSAEYSFKHGLLVDAAEQSMTRPHRMRNNSAIADAMIEQRGFDPERIARHLTLAGRKAEAVKHWVLAGQAALGRFALVESRQHLERGLRLLDGDESADAVAAEIEVRTTYGVPLMLMHGFASDEMAENYRALLDRCERVGADEAELVFPGDCGRTTK